MRTRTIVLAAVAAALVLLTGCVSGSGGGTSAAPSLPPEKTLRVISGSENKTLEPIIRDFEAANGVRVEMTYKGSVDIMNELKGGAPNYDAAWPANSIWVAMGDAKHVVKYSKSIMMTPIVFGIRESKAKELGWVGKPVSVPDILAAIQAKKLRFMMTSATQSNSGASAYLGFLYAMLGHPDQITLADLQKPELQSQVKTILSGVNRSSGSSDWLKELYLSAPDRYDAMVNYESLVIGTDQTLVSKGKEPLYVVYPADGLSLADSPLSYLDHGDAAKEALFKKFQDYMLSPQSQTRIKALGWRTELGGVVSNPDLAVFNPAWGVAVDKPLNVIRYPKPEVITAALALYQTELKKPSVTVFCIDFSGSMGGDGEQQVKDAMRTLLDPALAKDQMLQMGAQDKVFVIPFNQSVIDVLGPDGPTTADRLIASIDALTAGGQTDIYTPAIRALSTLKPYDPDVYSLSVVLMTDGESNTGANLGDFQRAYAADGRDIPVFSIMFGEANPAQLDPIAKATRGLVFDGKSDLIAAFKKVRGYN
jgi:Ca-activated chloride channel family protein